MGDVEGVKLGVRVIDGVIEIEGVILGVLVIDGVLVMEGVIVIDGVIETDGVLVIDGVIEGVTDGEADALWLYPYQLLIVNGALGVGL